jgi:hypothetical protein
MTMVPNDGLLSAATASSGGRERAGRDALSPSLGMRVLARARAFSLDRRLVAGEDLGSSRALAARAGLLTSERSRAAIAGGLRRIALSAGEAPRRMRVRPRGATALANQAALLSLAERLSTGEPLYARGLARLSRLVSDANGPSFRGGAAELKAELAIAERELTGDGEGPVRARARGRSRSPVEPTAFIGGSFMLPNGSWYHGRRES